MKSRHLRRAAQYSRKGIHGNDIMISHSKQNGKPTLAVAARAGEEQIFMDEEACIMYSVPDCSSTWIWCCNKKLNLGQTEIRKRRSLLESYHIGGLGASPDRKSFRVVRVCEMYDWQVELDPKSGGLPFTLSIRPQRVLPFPFCLNAFRLHSCASKLTRSEIELQAQKSNWNRSDIEVTTKW